MRKTTTIRIDDDLLQKSKTKANKMIEYPTYSSYINALIKNDLVNIEETKHLMEDTDDIIILEEADKLRKNKNALKLTFRIYKDYIDLQNQFIYTYFNSDTEIFRKKIWKTIISQCNKLLEIDKNINESIEQILNNIKYLRDAAENEDADLVLKLCNFKVREKKMLQHLMLKYSDEVKKNKKIMKMVDLGTIKYEE